MSKLRAVLLTGVVLAVGAGTLAYAVLSEGEEAMCGASVVRRIPSPDGRLEAVVFERDCGATTDFGTDLAVINAGDGVGIHTETVLVADSDHGRAPLDPGNVIRLSVRWVGSDSLIVTYDRRARILQRDTSVGGVRVRYEPVDVHGA